MTFRWTGRGKRTRSFVPVMKKLLSITAAAALVFALALEAAPATAAPRPTAARAVVSDPARVKWRLKLPGDYAIHAPAVGPDGTIYVDVTMGGLSAINPDGTIKWSLPNAGTGAGISGIIDVASDGTIYVAKSVVDPRSHRSVDGILALNPDGTQKWFFDNAGDFLMAGPNVGPDGNIYAVSDYLGIGFFSLTPQGVLRFKTGSFTEHGFKGINIRFGPNRAYFGFDMQGLTLPTFFGYDLNGGKVFEAGSLANDGEAAVGPNGNVVIPTFPSSEGYALTSYGPSGNLVWHFYEWPGNTEESPNVGSDNVAYTVRNLGSLYAIDPNGTVKFRYTGDDILGRPVVSPKNDVVFMGGRMGYGEPGLFLGVGTDGTPLFRVDLPDEPGFEPYGQLNPATPTFSPDGSTAYSVADVLGDGSTGTYCFLYAIDTTASAPVATVPSAPTSLRAKALSSSRIGLRWTDASANESGFRIERCAGPRCTSFVQIATVAADSTRFVDRGLAAGTSYTYRVRAYNGAGTSGYSNAATAKTL